MMKTLLEGIKAFKPETAYQEVPKAPVPPENSLQCACCGHTDVKSKYKHTCYTGMAMAILLAMMPIGLIIITAMKILNAD